jgi:hypothetical protein
VEAKRRQLINGNRFQLFGSNPDRLIAFICECGDADCHDTVLLTAAEYQSAAGADELLLHHKHGVAA